MITSARGGARRDTPSVICDAAVARFDRDGLAAVAMEDIAADAGVSRATLYYHFASKHDLMLEVLVRRAQHINDTIREELAYRPATVDVIVTANVRAIEMSG